MERQCGMQVHQSKQALLKMTGTANMMLTLADAIENGNPNEGTLVLDPEQCSLIVQSLRDKAARMHVDQDRSRQADEKPLIHVDQDRLVKHVEAALEVG